MLIGKEFDASALRSLLHTIAPNLYLVKSKLDFMKYKLYFWKSNLGAMVCNRFLRVL